MNPDFLDLLRALLAAEVRFLVVGAYARGSPPSDRSAIANVKLP